MENLAILIGNLGGDPEIRYSQAGKAVATFSLATTERWKNQAGEQQEATEWHKCVAWDKLGEICGKYLTKGSKAYVKGKIQTRKWQDKDGNDRYSTEIIVKEMKMLSPRSEGTGGGGGYDNQEPPVYPSGGTGDDVPF